MGSEFTFYDQTAIEAYYKFMYQEITWAEYEAIWRESKSSHIERVSVASGVSKDKICKLIESGFNTQQVQALIDCKILN